MFAGRYRFSDDELKSMMIWQHGDLPADLMRLLEGRLETGVDANARTTDPFMQWSVKERALIVVREYTPDPRSKQPVVLAMLDQDNPEQQLDQTRQLFGRKTRDSLLWIHINGIEEKAMNGIAHLCGLPPRSIYEALQGSEHRHHRSYVATHPSHTYIQLLIQQGQGSGSNTPIYDMVRRRVKRDVMKGAVNLSPPDRSSTGPQGDSLDISVGFMSIFICHEVNALVTVSLPYYDSPAARLEIHTAAKDMSEHGQLCVATDATLLAFSMVHRVVGYASDVVHQAQGRMALWNREIHHDLSTERMNEMRRTVDALREFQGRLKPLERVHQAFLTRQTHLDAPAIPAAAIQMIAQSSERLQAVAEEADGLIQRGEAMESYCFNMMSTRANDSMERLAIVTIVFLPLTFIASYFSMGFDHFPDLSKPHNYFWEVSVPASVVFFIVFAYSNLKRGYNLVVRAYPRLVARVKREWYYNKKDVELWYRQKQQRRAARQTDRASRV
ncbi:hypothetical protein IAU60_000233 [Kwoniella sp. DSM 27419]